MKCGFFPILYSSLAFNFVIYFSSKTFFALIKAGSDHSEKKNSYNSGYEKRSAIFCSSSQKC